MKRGAKPDGAAVGDKRYQQLLERYQSVVARLQENTRSESAFIRLSVFALQRSSSALAMFRDGRVVLANPRWYDLVSARDTAGRWSLYGASDRAYDDLATLAATELARLLPDDTMTLRCDRGGAQVLRLRLERVTPAGEETIGLVLADDVTAETAREAEVETLREGLKKREQMGALGRLAAGVAHDLGNTLNAIALRVQRLSHDVGAAGKSSLRDIEEAIAIMRSTLDRLDRFSGRRSRPLVAVDVRAVIRAALDVALLPATGRDGAGPRVDVALELPRRLPRVSADAAELTHVFVNLLINARDAMPRGGTVTVAAAAGPTRVTVRVLDEGSGFAATDLERVFEPFFTTKGARGSGLGLSLAYGFMEAIGGTIRAGNRRDGHGAEIVLELPVAGDSVLDGRRRVAGRFGVGRGR